MDALPRIVLMSAGLALAAGCTPTPPTLTPRSAEITTTTPAGLGLRVHLTANNPNRYDLTVQSINVRVNIAGQDLGAAEVPNATVLPSHQDTPVDADLTVPWVNLPSLVLATVMNPSVPYHLDGTVRVGGTRIHLDIAFHMESTMPRQILLDAAGTGVGPVLQQLPFLH